MTDPVKRLREVVKDWDMEARKLRHDANILIERAKEIEQRGLRLDVELDKFPKDAEQK